MSLSIGLSSINFINFEIIKTFAVFVILLSAFTLESKNTFGLAIIIGVGNALYSYNLTLLAVFSLFSLICLTFKANNKIFASLAVCLVDIFLGLYLKIYGTYTFVDGVKYENVKMADVLDSVTKLVDKKEMFVEKHPIGYEHVAATQEALTSKYIYPRLQEFIKENDIVVAETGIVPHGVAPMKFPNNVELQTQTLWGSIGWATPATLGVCLAKPKSRVILITGEGSHQLTAMELGNMLRRGIKPIVIVLNNKGYTIERVLSDSPDDKFNDIMQMNYAKFARVFDGDVWSTKVTTADDFDKALKVTQIMNKLCYIEICTEAMDMPQLTEDLIANFRKNTQKAETSTAAQYCEQEQIKEKNEEKEIFELKSDTNVSFNYETVVHKGLEGLE